MRVLVADDQNLIRETVAAFLLNSDGIAAVDIAASLDEALDAVANEAPYDVILLDYFMPGMNGLDGLFQMQKVCGAVPISIMSGTASPEVAQLAMEAGARGFVPKTLSAKSMVSAVKFMAMGEVFVPFEFMQGIKKNSPEDLSENEVIVLKEICSGQSNKEIAEKMKLPEATIKLRVKTLSRKLDARNRTHAAMIAKELNLV